MLFDSINYGVFLCPDCMYRSSDLLFKYRYFEWVGLLPGMGLELVYFLMGLGALGVMLGLFYRISAILMTLCFSYIFLLDQAQYLNHFYLAFLFSCLLIFVPANTFWALDAKRNPEIASSVVPNWGRFWLCAQLEIVLVYAGLVKINRDWLNLEPMRLWMTEKSAGSMEVFQWLTADWGIAIASYGAIVLHLVGAPLLLFQRTRLYALAAYVCFHLTNSLVFNIGIFPWMTIAATLMMFDPDWPLQVKQWWSSRWGRDSGPKLTLNELRRIGPLDSSSYSHQSGGAVIVFLMVVWLTVQVAVPLRHYFIPGDVAWSEGGHRFSWRMMLRSKRGTIKFVVVKEGERIIVDPSEHLNKQQLWKVTCLPDLIWQYAQFLEAEYSQNGEYNIAVYADALCSLNAREPAPLINRLVDLTDIPRDHPADKWLLPLSKPLPRAIF